MIKLFSRLIGAVLFLVVIALLLDSGSISGIAALSPFSGSGTALAQEQEIEKAVFKVKCYDEGRATLQGMKGIKKIETGFHYVHETDTVYYDPKMITIADMESALKKAGTYVETIEK
jgi:hypothetical protein